MPSPRQSRVVFNEIGEEHSAASEMGMSRENSARSGHSIQVHQTGSQVLANASDPASAPDATFIRIPTEVSPQLRRNATATSFAGSLAASSFFGGREHNPDSQDSQLGEGGPSRLSNGSVGDPQQQILAGLNSLRLAQKRLEMELTQRLDVILQCVGPHACGQAPCAEKAAAGTGAVPRVYLQTPVEADPVQDAEQALATFRTHLFSKKVYREGPGCSVHEGVREPLSPTQHRRRSQRTSGETEASLHAGLHRAGSSSEDLGHEEWRASRTSLHGGLGPQVGRRMTSHIFHASDEKKASHALATGDSRRQMQCEALSLPHEWPATIEVRPEYAPAQDVKREESSPNIFSQAIQLMRSRTKRTLSAENLDEAAAAAAHPGAVGQAHRMMTTKTSLTSEFHIIDSGSGRADAAKKKRRCSFRVGVMRPSSFGRLIMDLLSCMVLLYDLTLIPYALAWDVPFEGVIKYGTCATLAFWSVDMVASFRTGFYHNGEVEMRPAVIAKRYLRTFFVPDLLVISVDALSIFSHLLMADRASGDLSTTDGSRFLRFAKAGRILRICGFVRMLRTAELVERITSRQQATWGARPKVILEIMWLVFLITWINHVMSCGWYAIGRMGGTDTTDSWLNVADGVVNQKTYAAGGFWYQYTTAFHWSMTQMTPGSMQVFPLNSYERAYNIICLMFGCFFFSSLVGSFSTKLMQYKIANQAQSAELRMLRRFLRQAAISPQLAVSVEKQIAGRMSIQKPLTANEVPALAMLSMSLRIELQLELCRPHLLSHSFFRFWSEVDANSIRRICSDAIDFSALSPGENLFVPNTKASGAYLITSGSLAYMKAPFEQSLDEDPDDFEEELMLTRKEVRPVPTRRWFCEAALWAVWEHVGAAEAETVCEGLTMSAKALAANLMDHHLMRHLGQAYAQAFALRIQSAVPPTAPWPNDLEVPGTDYGELVLTMARQERCFMGMVALQVLLNRPLAWAWPAANSLREEILSGQCTLAIDGGGEVQRVVAVSALNLKRGDTQGGPVRVLAQLAKWTQGPDANGEGTFQTMCKLPGAKQEEGETSGQALRRVAEVDIAPFASGVRLLHSESVVEWKDSAKYRIKTKYMRTVHYAELREGFAAENLTVTYRAEASLHSLQESRGDDRGQRSGTRIMEEELSLFLHPVIVVPEKNPSCKAAGLYAWLTQEEFDRLSAHAGEPILRRWMDGIDMKEAIKSSRAKPSPPGSYAPLTASRGPSSNLSPTASAREAVGILGQSRQGQSVFNI